MPVTTGWSPANHRESHQPLSPTRSVDLGENQRDTFFCVGDEEYRALTEAQNPLSGCPKSGELKERSTIRAEDDEIDLVLPRPPCNLFSRAALLYNLIDLSLFPDFLNFISNLRRYSSFYLQN